MKGLIVVLLMGSLIACSKSNQPMSQDQGATLQSPNDAQPPEANQVEVPVDTTTMTPLLNSGGALSVRYSHPTQVVIGQQMMGRVSVSTTSQAVSGNQLQGQLNLNSQSQ